MAEEITGIRLAGLGGQGVILTGLLLGHAAVRDGLYAAGSSSYGAQSRGSLSKAEVVISSEPIDYPHVELADFFIAMSQEGYDAYANQVRERGMIYYDAGLVQRRRGNSNETGFDVTKSSVNALRDKQVANIIWVGILAGATLKLSERSIEEAIRARISERFLDLNLQALKLGLLLGRDPKER